MKTIIPVLALLLVGCSAPYHNIKEDGESPFGGGFMDVEVREGLYEIHATSNFKPWVNYDDAHRLFKRRAKDLCNGGYDTLNIKESHDGPVGAPIGLDTIESTVVGYAHCKNSPVSRQDVLKIINT